MPGTTASHSQLHGQRKRQHVKAAEAAHKARNIHGGAGEITKKDVESQETKSEDRIANVNADNNTAEETTQVSCCEAANEAAQATKEVAHTGSRRAHGGRKQTRFTMVGGAHGGR